ncbi:MAG: hypothetical protein EPO25_11555 [Gammaproteobacteria bacterium]|nr:MAG: hypothetical protein EPO25_11555 [Gammaproteobacteria bacterium]
MQEYLAYQHEQGLNGYAATPGNRGALVLVAEQGGASVVTVLSFWESRAAIHGFAGDDIEVARYYPRDAELLTEMPPDVRHYQLADGVGAVAAGAGWRGNGA